MSVPMKWVRLLNRLSDREPRGILPDYGRLATGLQSKHIVLGIHRVPKEAVEIAARRVVAHGNETEQHAFLKRVAVAWMLVDGYADARRELSVGGYRLDAYSPEKRWVIECGHTPPHRLVDLAGYLERPHHIMVLPFRLNAHPEDFDRQPLPPLTAVEMWISPEFCAAWKRSRRRASPHALIA